MNRRSFLKVSTMAMTSAILQTSVSAKPKDRPNVVVILVDDLGYGDLGCMGAADMRTPRIDALAARGMRFDQFYANCPVCSPTRAALLTGCFPDKVGVPGVIRTHRENSWGRLAPEATLLPAVLSEAGYHTAIVGKWHLGLTEPDTPNDRGFDFFHGFLGDMMEDYRNHRRHDVNYMRRDRETIDPEGHATEIFTQWAIDYVRPRAAEKDPFFLYLAYNAPHDPIQPPEAWVRRVKEREPGISDKRAELVAFVEHLDDGIGKFLDGLDDAGLTDNTLVIFASDNGGHLHFGANNGPLNGSKGDMFEGGIRVPACAAWPGHIPEGRVSHTLLMTMDLFPTVCEACGAVSPEDIDGRSFLGELLGGPADTSERTLVWVRREGGPRYGGRAYYAIRQGDWKLLQNDPFSPMQLFNLHDDPREAKPLDTTHKQYRPLFDRLRQHVNEAGVVPWQRAATPR